MHSRSNPRRRNSLADSADSNLFPPITLVADCPEPKGLMNRIRGIRGQLFSQCRAPTGPRGTRADRSRPRLAATTRLANSCRLAC